MHISEFTKHFVTTEEEKWINFISEHKTALQFIEKERDRQFYLPKDFITIVQKDAGLSGDLNKFEVVLGKQETPFHLELLQAVFAILVVLPMRKEIKLELKTLERTLKVY